MTEPQTNLLLLRIQQHIASWTKSIALMEAGDIVIRANGQDVTADEIKERKELIKSLQATEARLIGRDVQE